MFTGILTAIIGASQHLTLAKVRFFVELFAKTMSILLEKWELLGILISLDVFYIKISNSSANDMAEELPKTFRSKWIHTDISKQLKLFSSAKESR